jgi:hypothetical protein
MLILFLWGLLLLLCKPPQACKAGHTGVSRRLQLVQVIVVVPQQLLHLLIDEVPLILIVDAPHHVELGRWIDHCQGTSDRGAGRYNE